MPATKQELHYSERLLIRRALALYAGRLVQVKDLSEADKDEIQMADALQQAFKDAAEIQLISND